MCDGSPTQYGVPHNDFLKKKIVCSERQIHVLIQMKIEQFARFLKKDPWMRIWARIELCEYM